MSISILVSQRKNKKMNQRSGRGGGGGEEEGSFARLLVLSVAHIPLKCGFIKYDTITSGVLSFWNRSALLVIRLPPLSGFYLLNKER